MKTAKDICKYYNVKKHQYDHAKNILFPNLPSVGTGKSFEFTVEDTIKFRMFFLLNKTNLFRSKQIKNLLDGYNYKNLYILEERVFNVISAIKELSMED